MKNSSQPISLSGKFALAASLAGSLGFALCLAGCSSSATSSSATSQQTTPVYMAPTVSGTGNNVGALVYSVDDDTNGTFQATDYDTLSTLAPVASQTLYSGNVAAGLRGLHTLATTESYSIGAISGTTTYQWLPTRYDPAVTGGFAVELSGQAGGLVQLAELPVAPVVDAAQCPDSSTHTYQFITLPLALQVINKSGIIYQGWNPATDTAYGSVVVSSSGSTVNLQKINLFTMSSVSVSGARTSATGACGTTSFGNVTNVSEQLVITDPGSNDASVGVQKISTQAIIGIGAGNGLLVEDNGSSTILGAGTGAVGLAKPSSDITSAAVGAQYLGFIYSPGVYDSLNPSTPKNMSSHLASFGFPTVPSGCPSVTASTSPSAVIYGGDYDPTISSSGYGNCDFAIDLGPQNSYGLYPNATIYMGASYSANTQGKFYSFPAVAIAGLINGKYAVFLLGYDNSQPWTVYLLQSN